MRLLILFILLLYNCTVNGQGFKTRYKMPFGTNAITKAIFETSQGQYLGFGYCEDTLNGKFLGEIVTMGLNANGNVNWIKKYGGQKLLYLNNTFTTRSIVKKGNNFFYAGCIRDTANKQIGVLIKFDMNGDTLWQKIFKDQLQDVIPQFVNTSADGGLLITGFFQNGGVQTMLIKTDSYGNELWRKKINKPSPDISDGKAIIQDSVSKKIVIVGFQQVISDTHDNIIVLDSLGNKLDQTFYTNIGGILYDVIQTRDKKFIAIGYQYFFKKINGSNALLMRSFALKFSIDSINKPIWKYNGFDTLEFNNAFDCIRECSNGDIIIGGGIDTSQLRNLNTNILTRITILDKNGNLKSNRYYDYKTNGLGADNNQTMNSLELTSDGGYIAAITQANLPNPNPLFFVKYDSSGCDSTAAHCATLNMVGINELKTKDVEIKVYPNPAKTGVYISCISSNIDVIDISITDVLGRNVYKSKMPANQLNYISLDNLNSGLYIIKGTYKNSTIANFKIIKQE